MLSKTHLKLFKPVKTFGKLFSSLISQFTLSCPLYLKARFVQKRLKTFILQGMFKIKAFFSVTTTPVVGGLPNQEEAGGATDGSSTAGLVAGVVVAVVVVLAVVIIVLVVLYRRKIIFGR